MEMRTAFASVVAVLLVAATAPVVRANATVIILNNDGVNEGFNDPAPRLPVGGNPGTTLGQQRLNAFQFAADRWAATLDSPVPIVVQASFDPLTCTASGATLGAAGTTFIVRDFPQAGLAPGPVGPNLWHAMALADKRAGGDLGPGLPDIAARFNSNLNGNPACLGGRGWYLGFDANHGSDFDLVTVLLHELGHGMGFQQFANVSDGGRPQNFNDVFNVHIFDNTTHKT